MYTKSNATHKNGTLLVDGTIVSGAIFGTTFVAGTWMGEELQLQRMHPLRRGERMNEPFTFDIAGRDGETVDDGFGFVQYVVRVSRDEVK